MSNSLIQAGPIRITSLTISVIAISGIFLLLQMFVFTELPASGVEQGLVLVPGRIVSQPWGLVTHMILPQDFVELIMFSVVVLVAVYDIQQHCTTNKLVLCILALGIIQGVITCVIALASFAAFRQDTALYSSNRTICGIGTLLMFLYSSSTAKFQQISTKPFPLVFMVLCCAYNLIIYQDMLCITQAVLGSTLSWFYVTKLKIFPDGDPLSYEPNSNKALPITMQQAQQSGNLAGPGMLIDGVDSARRRELGARALEERLLKKKM